MNRTPFVGLRPFEEEDAPLFYGRDEQIDELLERLEHRKFLAVVGLSGSGKSSLVKAGLIPALYCGRIEAVGSHWRVVTVRPAQSQSPVDALAEKLGTADASGLIRSSSLGLLDWISANLQPEERLLVVADQFEEIFRDGETEQTEDDLAFVRLLLEGSAPARSRLVVVLTIRADFLGQCGRFRGLPEAMNESQYLVPRLSRDQIREAIVKPIKSCRSNIAPGLVTRLINDAGDDPTQLPVLQHALLRLWQEAAKGEEISDEHYRNIGFLSGALDVHGERILKNYSQDPERQRIVRILFQRITGRKEGGQLTRCRTPLKKIWEVTARTPEEAKSKEHIERVNGVVQDFRAEDVTFLSPHPRDLDELGPGSLIDLSHETLMLHWKTLKDWIEEESGSERRSKRIAEDAADQAAGRAPYYGNDANLATALEWAGTPHNEAWAQRYGGNLKGVLSFIQKSADKVREGEKAKLWSRVRFGGIAAFCLLLLIALVVGNVYQVRKDRLALARKLSMAASYELVVDPERSILLARQGALVSYTPEAANAANGALQQFRLKLSTPVQKFTNVLLASQAASFSWAESLARRVARSALVNFHSKGFAVASQ